MKKTMKWAMGLLATFTLSTASLATPALAQETDWDTIITELQATNQEVVSMAGDGNISLAVADQLDGTLNFDFRYNLEPRFAMELNGALDAQIAQTMVTGETGEETTTTEMFPVNFSGKVSLVDGIAYLFDGASWTVEDFSAMEEQFTAEFTKYMEQAQNQTAALEGASELTKKYFDMSETDTEYVFAMKEGINSEEFFADLNEYVDMDAVMQESIDQAIAEAQAQGQELTEEEIQQIEDQALAATQAGLKLVFEVADRMEVRYSKETQYLTYFGMDVNVTEEDIAQVAQEVGETVDTSEFAGMNIVLSMEFNFSDHGQTFDIVVPADAPTFDDSSAEPVESTEDAE